MLDRIRRDPAARIQLLLRSAGLVAALSGLIGGYVWLVDLADRSDGDGLRYGFWHNPFMQFPPFNETFLDISMWVLLACSAASGLGGLMLLAPLKWGVPLVTWQARISVIVNGVIAFFIIAAMSVFAKRQWDEWHLGGTPEALVLRLGSIVVDLTLWAFLSSRPVSEFLSLQSSLPAERSFEVIVNESAN